MKRCLSLLIVFVLVVASISCAAPKQKEIDAIREFAASTGTALYSVQYNSSSGIIEVVAPMEGINSMFTDYLTGDELSVENWNSLKEVMPEAEDYILTQLSSLGYSIPISLSFSDTLSPDVPILTCQGGKIVYEATEVPVETASPSLNEGSGTPVADNSLSNDPDGAVSVLKEFFAMNKDDNCTYTIQFNATAGNIEILEVSSYMANTLEFEYMPEGVNKISNGDITMREGLISNWNTFNCVLRDNGYSVPISFSISDREEPEKILLTIINGEIVFDSFD